MQRSPGPPHKTGDSEGARKGVAQMGVRAVWTSAGYLDVSMATACNDSGDQWAARRGHSAAHHIPSCDRLQPDPDPRDPSAETPHMNRGDARAESRVQEQGVLCLWTVSAKGPSTGESRS